MTALPITRATDVVTLTVRINDSDLPRTVPVLNAEVVSQANRIPYARLRIGDGDSARGNFTRSSSDLFVPGNKIVLLAGYHGETESIFTGVVTSQRLVVRTGASWLEVDCRDPTFAMTLVRRNRFFTDHKDSAVVKELLDAYAKQNVSGDIAETDVTHPQLLQYNATDWDFMISRLETAGHLCFVSGGKVSSVKPKLDAEPVAEIGFGATVLEMDAEVDARTQTGGVRAIAWDPAGQALQEAKATDPSWAGTGNLTADKLSKAAGREEDLIMHGGSLASDALQNWADGALLRARLAAARGRVRFQGVSKVVPGSVLQLSRFSDRFNGKVYVTGVRHEFSSGTWTTDAEFGMTRELHAERVPLTHVPAAGIAAAVHGLQVGVVTEFADDPGKEHRVRVKVPLAGVDKDGIWARVATIDAGKDRGTFFRPEKDDEVVLGFFQDDPAQPVILGMLHSSAKAPPEKATKDNDKKVFVSRSGIALRFDDKKKSVTIETPGGRQLVLDDDAGSIVLKDKKGNSITLDDKGIALNSVDKITLTAKTDLKADAMKAEIKASVGFKAEGKAQAEISSSGALTVKGSVVMIN
jgi:Rhs element Vgr protein